MWHIRRTDPLRLIEGCRFVSFVGAGGKTSLMEYLAARAVARGLSTAITTTTKIWARKPYVVAPEGLSATPPPVFLRIGGGLEEGKLTACDFPTVEHLGGLFDLVLIEADGAKSLPLKCPAPHEPVIPPFSERVFVIAGLDALGGTYSDKVFRWQLLGEEATEDGKRSITGGTFLRLLSPRLMRKGVDPDKTVVVLNKYDALRERGLGMELAKGAASSSGGPILLASVLHGIFYLVEGPL